MTKIKICFIANNANHSGAARALWQIIKHIDKSRFECIIIVDKIGIGLSKLTTYAPCYTFKLKSYRYRYTYRIRKFISFLFEKKWFISKLKGFNPDIIYFNTNASIQYMKWTKEASIKAKIICHIHGQNEGITYQMMLPEGNKPLSKEKKQITQSFADHYIACACASKEVLIREMGISSDKITVAHESIDIAEIKYFDKVVDRNAMGWHDKLVIGVVASLNYRKGADIFIEAANIIQNQIPTNNFLFLWLGTDGSYSTSKKNSTGYAHYCQLEIDKYKLTDKLLLLGHKQDVYMYMKHMDVFVLPSRDECLPLSILEAMVLEIPVVSTAVSGIPEVINHTNGILVQPNAQSLANGILRAIEEKEAGDFSKIEKASADVSDFDITKQIKKIEQCISTLNDS